MISFNVVVKMKLHLVILRHAFYMLTHIDSMMGLGSPVF
jgi:hypothetical protein